MTQNPDAEGRGSDAGGRDREAEGLGPGAGGRDPEAGGRDREAEGLGPGAGGRDPEAVADAQTKRDTRVSGATRHGARWWVAASVAIVFGLFYAYDLFEAISNLVGVAQLNGIATNAGIDPPVPWSLPIITVALPPVAYVVALLAGKGRRIGTRALLLLTGLASVGALTLSVTALVSYF